MVETLFDMFKLIRTIGEIWIYRVETHLTDLIEGNYFNTINKFVT